MGYCHSIVVETNSKVNHQLSELCDQLRSENSSIRIANDRLLDENQTLRETLKTPRGLPDEEEEGRYTSPLN